MKSKEQEFYNNIGKTIGWDFSRVKYETVDNSKFQYFQEINKICKDKILLDIGTGGAEKILENIKGAQLIVGTDFSQEMVEKAKEKSKSRKDVKIMYMDSNKLNFSNDFFDVICARHTPFNSREIYRTLKRGGTFISEQIDEDDCIELKEIFGRGQGYGVRTKQREKDELSLKKEEFSNIKFYDILQEEYYKTQEDLLFLLKNTPIISNFGETEEDYKCFNEYVNKNTTEKGIYLKRKLYGIIAKK